VNIESISQMPTCIETPEGTSHESVLRSYHIVQKVKWLLELKTSPEVILELIDMMEVAPVNKEASK
jgi:hypothetical protein